MSVAGICQPVALVFLIRQLGRVEWRKRPGSIAIDRATSLSLSVDGATANELCLLVAN